MRRRLPLAAIGLCAIGLAGCKDPTPAGPDAAPASSGSAGGAGSSPAASGSASAAPAPPPSPIEGALPQTAPHALDRRAECAKDACTLAHLVPDEVRPALSNGAPIVIWEQAIGERATVVFPRDEVVELHGVVLDGSLDLTPMEAPNARTVGGRWAAFRAPGGGVTLGGTGGKAARVALVVAAGSALGAHLDQRDRPGAPPSWAWKTRKKPVDTFSFAERPDLAWGAGAYHARIGWEGDEKPAAVIDVLLFSKDAGVAEHVHEHEWEALALLDGDGALVRGTGPAEERLEAHAGSIVTIPAGVRHTWKPSGKAPLLALQVYAPPGPEQRFRKLAGKAP
jgi:mannose-6-phosphate isomerase-like protein (cupin superfamily)